LLSYSLLENLEDSPWGLLGGYPEGKWAEWACSYSVRFSAPHPPPWNIYASLTSAILPMIQRRLMPQPQPPMIHATDLLNVTYERGSEDIKVTPMFSAIAKTSKLGINYMLL
jgi:hypothetical protein